MSNLFTFSKYSFARLISTVWPDMLNASRLESRASSTASHLEEMVWAQFSYHKEDPHNGDTLHIPPPSSPDVVISGPGLGDYLCILWSFWTKEEDWRSFPGHILPARKEGGGEETSCSSGICSQKVKLRMVGSQCSHFIWEAFVLCLTIILISRYLGMCMCCMRKSETQIWGITCTIKTRALSYKNL